jgi:hypothetical protein
MGKAYNSLTRVVAMAIVRQIVRALSLSDHLRC